MCKDPVHSAYKIKAVKWFILALVAAVTFFCPDCWGKRIEWLTS